MHNDFHNKNNYYLCITNLFFLLGIIYFSLYSKKTFIECALAFILTICFTVSEIFWINPIRFSRTHVIDGFCAKFAIICFILYTLCCKKMDAATTVSYFSIILLISITFYYSHFYSSNDWCCDDHIFYHGIMHMVGFMGITYAFYPS